jgi:hypothetical protein
MVFPKIGQGQHKQKKIESVQGRSKKQALFYRRANQGVSAKQNFY